MDGELRTREVGRLLDDLARQEVGVASGSAAALTTAFAASLTTMVARGSRERWPDAGGAIAGCTALGARLVRLAEENADAFGVARGLMLRGGADRERHGAPVAPGAAAPLDPAERERHLASALHTAAELPVLIAEAAAEVTALAAEAAREGNADLRADAVVAATLAEAGASAAAHLVGINLGLTPEDPLRARASAAAEAAAVARAGAEG